MYFFGYGEPTLKKIFNSIWEIFGDENDLKKMLEVPNDIVYFSKIASLEDYVNINEIIKFEIHGFYIENYKEQLEILFRSSNELLKLNNFTWKEFEWHEVEEIECLIEINNIQKVITIEKSKWYDFKFPEKINRFLNEINSQYRISLVHENSWDETHGVKLSKLDEFEILMKNKLIVG